MNSIKTTKSKTYYFRDAIKWELRWILCEMLMVGFALYLLLSCNLLLIGNLAVLAVLIISPMVRLKRYQRIAVQSDLHARHALTKFRFHCDDVFAIHGRGLVLHGYLLEGEIRSNQLIAIPTNQGTTIGRINGLELNRVIVDHVDSDANIGILMNKFNENHWMDVLNNLPSDELEAESFGSIAERLGLELPSVLTGPMMDSDFESKS